MLKLVSPLAVQVGKKQEDRFILNLNNYRNAHYFLLNNAKRAYKEAMAQQIRNLPQFDKLFVIYQVYPKTLREFDLGNVASIHEKFFLDAMVELGKLQDDNYKFAVGSCNLFGQVDKMSPRVEIHLNPQFINTGKLT